MHRTVACLAKASPGGRPHRHLLPTLPMARSWVVRAPIPIQAPRCTYAAPKCRGALFPENGFRATATCHLAVQNKLCVLTRSPTERHVGATTAEAFTDSLKWAETSMAARSIRAASTTSTPQVQTTAISPASSFPMEAATYRSAELRSRRDHPLKSSMQPAVDDRPGTRPTPLPILIRLPRHSRFRRANWVIPGLGWT